MGGLDYTTKTEDGAGTLKFSVHDAPEVGSSRIVYAINLNTPLTPTSARAGLAVIINEAERTGLTIPGDLYERLMA